MTTVAGTRTLVAGASCLITDDAGDVTGHGVDGLFVADTRHLSRWTMRVHGLALRPLASTPGEVVLAPPASRGENPPFACHRRQRLDAGGLTEELVLTSFLDTPQTLRVGYAVEADFADQFELRSSRVFDKSDAVRRSGVAGERLTYAYSRQGFHRATELVTVPPARLDPSGAHWTLTLPPRGEATLRLRVSALPGASKPRPLPHAQLPDPLAPTPHDHGVPEVVRAHLGPPDHGGRDALARCVRQGLADLDALRMTLPADGSAAELAVPAAGVPWFLTLFGRDSILASLFALAYRPELAEGTLRALAATQGRRTDPERLEEPGKIIHELRRGELATLGEVPYARYYGTVDATPLFLVLLAAYHEQTGDDVLAKDLEPAARAAVRWMRDHGGLGATGYLRYRTDGQGLVHHCWKDSRDSIAFADGRVAAGPIAVCEAQAYAYRGLRGAAALARTVWGDPGFGRTLDGDAERLREVFAVDFRLANGFVALALDRADRQVDALASNAGHVLWSGIMDDRWAESVARRLAEDDFFSGWGIRTLAAGQRPYHPMSYHRGGVWPHDTAIAVAGLVAAGLRDDAARVADGLLAAAAHTGDRLPEVMTGLRRRSGTGPVPYPHSCSPQAWAAAAPLLLASVLGG